MGQFLYGILRGSWTIATSAEQGTYDGQFDLPASTTYRTACEAYHSRTIDTGTDDYYALAFKFPTNWTEPGDTSLNPGNWWGDQISSLNYELIWGAPVGLQAHADHLTITAQSGYCNDVNSPSPGCAYVNSFNAIPVGQLTLGVWHELIVHVHWTFGTDGVIEAWHRLKGQSAWTKTGSITGYPTLQSSSTYPNGNPNTNDKFGSYRPQSPNPLTMWHDSWCRATSFDAAASCL